MRNNYYTAMEPFTKETQFGIAYKTLDDAFATPPVTRLDLPEYNIQQYFNGVHYSVPYQLASNAYSQNPTQFFNEWYPNNYIPTTSNTMYETG